MIKRICDRCGQVIEVADRFYIAYTGDTSDRSANLCKECSEKFLSWMENESVESKVKDWNSIMGLMDATFEGYRDMVRECIREIKQNGKTI